MSRQPVIKVRENEKWSNWHRTLDVGGTPGNILQPQNEYEQDQPPPGQEFLPGLEGLQKIVKEAQSAGMRVRAHGSGWSLNNIAYTSEYLVDSNSLGYIKVGLPSEQLTDTYKNKGKLLVFSQCGVMVQKLNNALRTNKLSLPTSGASDGQRIVGAIATGTHGSAHAVGAMTEFVRGIHAVVLDRHVFIQRASDQVVNETFGQWINDAEIINDDDLFNAALVGFGGFGLTHALLLEVEPQYLLERVIQNYPLSDVRDAITKWDFSKLDLPYKDKMPFHFECVINPYPIPDSEKGAFVRVYYRHEVAVGEEVQAGPDSDTPDLHTAIAMNFDEARNKEIEQSDQAEDLERSTTSRRRAETLGILMQIALHISFPTQTPDKPRRIPGKWFTGKNSADLHTNSPIPATSLELGVPFERVGDAMDLVLDVTSRFPFAAPLAFRYVKKSTATLGFTGLGDITVTMEMPGPFGRILFPRTGLAHDALFKALAESDIPHSFHWGQQFPKNTSWVRRTYGDAAVDQWMAQREKLLGAEGIKIFSNRLIGEIGLGAKIQLSFIARLKRFFRNLLRSWWRSKDLT